jgi:flagellar protein FliO/FliZ
MSTTVTLLRAGFVCAGTAGLLSVAPLAWAEAASPGPGTAQIAQLVIGLVVVVAGVFLFARILARIHGGNVAGSGPLRVVAAVAVGQRERVVLMQVGDRQVLLGVTPSRISRLHELDAAQGVVEAPAAPAIPSTWLARALSRRT